MVYNIAAKAVFRVLANAPHEASPKISHKIQFLENIHLS